MNNWVEPPPPRKKRGCLKGCLAVFIFLLLIVAAILFIAYRSITSAKLPEVTPDPVVAEQARTRWENFQAAAHSEAPAVAAETPAAVEQQAAPGATPTINRVEFTADDINQLITANRKARGKAYVQITNNVVYAQVSVPLKKLAFAGKSLIVSGEIHPSPDRDPRKVTVRNLTLGGVDFPDSVLNSLIKGRSLQSYLDEYASEYQVSSFDIQDNKVILETSAPLQ